MRHVLGLVVRFWKDHLQADQKEDDASCNLDGVIADAQEVHQAIAQETKQDDDAERNQELPENDPVLAAPLYVFQKTDVERNISNRIHEEEKGKRNSPEVHHPQYTR